MIMKHLLRHVNELKIILVTICIFTTGCGVYLGYGPQNIRWVELNGEKTDLYYFYEDLVSPQTCTNFGEMLKKLDLRHYIIHRFPDNHSKMDHSEKWTATHSQSIFYFNKNGVACYFKSSCDPDFAKYLGIPKTDNCYLRGQIKDENIIRLEKELSGVSNGNFLYSKNLLPLKELKITSLGREMIEELKVPEDGPVHLLDFKSGDKILQKRKQKFGLHPI